MIRRTILSALFLAMSLATIFWVTNLPLILDVPLTDAHYLSGFLALSLAAVFLKHPYPKGPRWITDIMAAASFAVWAWAAWKSGDWLLEFDPSGLQKWGAALLALVLLLEALRKCMGWGVTIVIGVFALYAFFGQHLPSPLTAAPADPRRIAMYFYSDYNGIPGMVLSIAATIIMSFILFSKTLSHARAIEFFDLVSTALFAGFRGGAGKIAVVSSSMLGLISGSVIGNIMTSGSMTLPMMKRAGFSARYAAAIETVASNAGQITPPIMGATAFLIAQFLQMPYADVVVAAAFPAFMIYIALFVQIDAYAAKNGIEGTSVRERPEARRLLRTGLPFVLAMGCLVGLIFLQGRNIAVAALIAAALTYLLHVVLERGRGAFRNLISILRESAEDMLSIIVIAAAAGLLIGSLNFTGLGFRMTQWLSVIAENTGIFPMLLVTAGLCILLGMGMPTAAVYILLSSILGPSLIHVGVEPLAAHMFIFYFGLLSMLTPPVAIASYTAAGLAGAKMGETSITALRLAAIAFIVPFLFVLEPALLGQRGFGQLLLHGVPVAISVAVLAWGFEASVGRRRLRAPILRPILVIAAIAVAFLSVFNAILGLAASAVLLAASFVFSSGTTRAPEVGATGEQAGSV
ncbi:MAG: TRAP transporter fused permease subunit [Pseudomonadota bacterium]|nr:TRAP transporter fused permease subunit [Pseudomonadota bacterium]